MLCLFFPAQIVKNRIYVKLYCGEGVCSVARSFYGTLRKYTMFSRYALVLVCDEARVATHAATSDTCTRDGGAKRTDGWSAACFGFGSAAAAGLGRETVKEGPQTRRRFLSGLSLANTVWLNLFKSNPSGRQPTNVMWKCKRNALNAC